MTNKNNLSPFKRLINLLTLERRDIFQVFYYAIFSGFMSLTLPLGIQAIINLIQGAQISTSWIVLVILVTIGVVFNGALQLMQLRIIETIQQRIFVRSSFDLTYRFPKMKMKELRNSYAPELANRFFDTLTVQKGLSKILIDVPTSLLQIIFALILLSFYHPFFIIFGVVLVALFILVFQYSAQKGLETSLLESKHKYKVAHWIQEVARSLVSFKLSGTTHLALHKNDKLVDQYIKAREGHFGIIRLQFIKMIAFKVLITAGLLIVGGLLVLNQQMNIGQFVAAEIIILLVITSVEKLIYSLETIYDTLTSIEKLGQIVDKELEPQTGETLESENNMFIKLEKVSYKAPGQEVNTLNKINIDFPSGSKTLIRGENGSGKSTLIKVITGIISPNYGGVYINNLPLKSLNINSYRSSIGESLSEEMPFEGTLKENLTFGNPNIGDREIFRILEIVNLTSFLKKLDQGLQTNIYPEGKQIPTTISKKIILARALLKNPKILILENAFFEFEITEADLIIRNLNEHYSDLTFIIVSSSPIWDPYCDREITLTKESN